MLRYLPFLLILAVWIFAFIDCLNTPENEVRKLPKLAWVIIVLLFGQVLIGPIAWFVAGRPRRNAPYGAVRKEERRWVAPDDNPDFLKSLGDGERDGGSPGAGPEEPRDPDRRGRDGGPEDTPPAG
ncbi:PLD nuclease N-terminal domain-containing protein [Streptomyces sp. TRM 70351]|uniref:PLD nuclease N-terminal domain-containing protein n=1 Tax=Streptomyces sp. TRM 70351 TaxID=3116552 RepID=UPI002E7AEB68|nr:PLD nuclease N-terminal domain-containing protein [Streptomyces sp. TRM 70351]MEE1931035.1 PLD nuclease N-terminal domain-containing protein [Streptomyces sp. TRM 70351]